MKKWMSTLWIWIAFLLGAYVLRSLGAVLPLFFYLAAVNVVGLSLMLADKGKARRHGARRVPEATLFGVTAAGGGIGTLAGMYGARHKTRKTAFRLGFPLLTLVNALWLIYWF